MLKFLSGIFLFSILGCSTTFEKELMSKYPMESWKSARHQGDEYNYDHADAWVEPKDGQSAPIKGYRVYLPFTPDVIHAFPGRYFFFKKSNQWVKYRFNDNLDDIEPLSSTDYSRMFTWGNNTSIVGGLKKDGTLDIINTYNGKTVVNLKDVDAEAPVSLARHAVFVRMKNGTFKNIRATNKPPTNQDGDMRFYPSQFTLSPYVYHFGGEVQNISFGIREDDGIGHMDLFYRGDIKDLGKNEENAKVRGNEKYVQETKGHIFLDFGQSPEKRFVLLRDGEVTPTRYKELDNQKVKDLIWMRAQQGTPRAIGLMMPDEKGAPHIHLLKFWDYWGSDSRRLRQGTFEVSKKGFKDAMGSYTINTVNYIEQPVVVGQLDDDKWDYIVGDLRRDEDYYTGFTFSDAVKLKGAADNLPGVLKVVREQCASSKMNAQQIAKARSDYESRMYRDGIRAREAYDTAIRQIEYRKKLAEYQASQQASQEFQEALGSISGSLARGATSNAPKGPRGFDDRYDSTGAGYNRYQKWVEKEAKRKARPGQN